MPWEEEEATVLRKRKGGLKKSGATTDSVWSFHDLLTVTFHETVQCVLIPSRHDYRDQGLLEQLWYSDEEIMSSTDEAGEELLMTVPTNVSTMSLYAAMNLLYRPCSVKGKISHFNILIVDDSVVARKMITLHLVQQHKESGIEETIYIHHADSYHSALRLIKKKTFNVVIIDHVLSATSDAWAHPMASPHREVSEPPKSALKGSSSSRGGDRTTSSGRSDSSNGRGQDGGAYPGAYPGAYTWSDSNENLGTLVEIGIKAHGASEEAMSEVSSLVPSEFSGLTNDNDSSTHFARIVSPEPQRRRQPSADSSHMEGESMQMAHWREVPTDNDCSYSSDARTSPSRSEGGLDISNRNTPERSLLTRVEHDSSPTLRSQGSMKFKEKVSAVDTKTLITASNSKKCKIPGQTASEDDKGSTSSGSTDFAQSSFSAAASGMDSAREAMKRGNSNGGSRSRGRGADSTAESVGHRSIHSLATGTSIEELSDSYVESPAESEGRGNKTRTRISEGVPAAPQPHRHRRSNSSHHPPTLEWGQMPGLKGGKQADDDAASTSTTSSSASNDRDQKRHNSRNKGAPAEQPRELTSSNPRLPRLQVGSVAPANSPAGGSLALVNPGVGVKQIPMYAPVAINGSPGKRLPHTRSDLTKLMLESSGHGEGDGKTGEIPSALNISSSADRGKDSKTPDEEEHSQNAGAFSSIVGDASGIGRELLRPRGPGRRAAGSCSPDGAVDDRMASYDSTERQEGSDPSLGSGKGYVHSGSDSDSPLNTIEGSDDAIARDADDDAGAGAFVERRDDPPSPTFHEVSQGLGLGGKAKNSFNEIQRLKERMVDDKSSSDACSLSMQETGDDIDAGAFALPSKDRRGGSNEHDADPQHVIVGIEGKLSTLQSWEQSSNGGVSGILSNSTANTRNESSAEGSLRMADLYRGKQRGGASTSDLSVNSSSSHDASRRSVFESYKEPKISMADVDPGAWNGKDIIEVIREDTPCLIVGISSHIISDFDEAYDEGTHTVTAIRNSNNLRADFYRAGADLVWAKPVPKDAWKQIYDIMPIEF